MVNDAQLSGLPISNYSNIPAGTGTQASPYSPTPSASPSGVLTDVDKSTIGKNDALKWLIRVLMVICPIILAILTGGILVWLYTTSNSISANLGAITADINSMKISIDQLRNDKNRDIDRLQKELDDLTRIRHRISVSKITTGNDHQRLF